MNQEKIQNLILRIALSFAFFYVAYAATQDPVSWISYAPSFIQQAFPLKTFMVLFDAFHILIGVWILSGWRIFVPSVLAAIFLAGVVAFNLSQMNVLFRDISLLLLALSLAVKNYRTTY